MATIQTKIILESDSQIAIRAIMGAIKALNTITNIIEDILVLASAIRNIKFVYRNRHANILADIIARKAHNCIAQNIHLCNAQTVFIYQQFFVLFQKR